MFGSLIAGNSSAAGSMKKPGRPHLSRWYSHIETLDIPRQALESFQKAKSDADKGKKAKRLETVEVVLPNAVPGKVVVRFGELALLSRPWGI
jgi:glutamyl-tRNA synthetase